MHRLGAQLLLVALVSLSGCATYVTPGGPVSFAEISEPDVAEAFAREPAASFPAHVVVARVQAPGYTSASNRGYGSGTFSVLTTRDIEREEDFARIKAMPGVADVGPMSRVLLPAQLKSTRDLRAAAAQLRGDVVLLYSLDTSFRTETLQVGPLQAIALGFFPNKKAHVTATCAAAFVDVRTGYVYGIAEASATEEQRGNVWSTAAAIEDARATAERAAFVAALGEIETTWRRILIQHAAAR